MGRAFTCSAGGLGTFSILTKCFFSPKVVGKTEKLLFLNCFVLVNAEINLIGVLPGPITGLQSTKSVVIEKNSCYLVNHRLRLSIQKKGIMRRNARLSNVLIISSTYFATTKLDTYCIGFIQPYNRSINRLTLAGVDKAVIFLTFFFQWRISFEPDDVAQILRWSVEIRRQRIHLLHQLQSQWPLPGFEPSSFHSIENGPYSSFIRTIEIVDYTWREHVNCMVQKWPSTTYYIKV